MKEYLNMSDVFDEVVHSKYEYKGVGNAIFEECGALLGDFVTLGHAEYASHAINSHDKLVAEVERLTEFCENFSKFCEDVSEFMNHPNDENSYWKSYQDYKKTIKSVNEGE